MAIDKLNKIETEIRSAWVAHDATPFICDLDFSQDLLRSAERAVRQHPIATLLREFPALGVWAILFPLAKNYVAADREIYPHLEAFLNEAIPSSDRGILKTCFCSAARRIGIPVNETTDPTKLFFAPLGVPDPQHGDLARAFLCTARDRGPPAIEDTVAARHWQRIAVLNYCAGQKRLHATIHFDESAHYARRFDAWRRGDVGSGSAEQSLFKEYETQARRMGRSRSDFAGPPALIWHRNGLGLAAERSSGPQSIKDGLFPTPLSAGKRISIAAPWPNTIQWNSGDMSLDIAFAPADREVLLFDADSGALIQRVSASTGNVQVPTTRTIALSRRAFACPSFGDAIPTIDPDVHCAWTDGSETLTFQDRADLEISQPLDTAIWFRGCVLGRNGSNAIYANDLSILMRLNSDIGGKDRIIRAKLGDVVRLLNIRIDANHEAGVNFLEFGFDPLTDPGRVTFEVLVPGAAGDPNARADLMARCWIWPCVTQQTSDVLGVPVPGNYDPSHSAGLHIDSFGILSVNEHADVETPILGLVSNEQTLEFDLAARSEKLWHLRVGNDGAFVPKGTTLQFGYENRHDMLRLRCFDRDADLIVLGNVIRRPFIQRQVFEIGAEKLEVDTGDDRIAIQRADGRVDLLARLRRVNDTAGLTVEEADDLIRLSFKPTSEMKTLRVSLQPVSGPEVEGDYGLGHLPVANRKLSGIDLEQNPADDTITIILQRSELPSPARVHFYGVDDHGSKELLKDGSLAPVAVGLHGEIQNPKLADLVRLATFLADPEPEALGGQYSRALYPAYRSAFAKLGANRTVASVKAVLNVVRDDGGTARHDVVGVAPWIFEASPHAFSGFKEGTGFSSFGSMSGIEAPFPLPDLDCAQPLATWLERVDSEGDLPEGLDTSALQRAFRTLRFRLAQMDMKDLLNNGAIGNSARIICSAYAENLDDMRAFDADGGGDPMPAKMAIQIERFARAAADGRVEEFLSDLSSRTGLPMEDVGYTMTMMVRAAADFFVYFRALWAHAMTARVAAQ